MERASEAWVRRMWRMPWALLLSTCNIQRDGERHGEAQGGIDWHREKCGGIGSADAEVALGAFVDIDSFQSLKNTERCREVRRGA